MLAWAAIALACATGCAPAHPALVGASTTPTRRADVGVGGAARVALGDLRNDAIERANDTRYREVAEGAGVAPAAFGRYGLPGGYDLGLLAAGTLVRAEVRRESVIREGTTRPAWVYGLAPYAGYIAEPAPGDGQGHRLGLEVPVTYGVEIGGIYEVWAGARVGVERLSGAFGVGAPTDAAEQASASGVGLRAGGVLGLGLGFRRLHALIELTASYERYWVDHGGRDLDRGGLVLTPAFALRLRL